MLRAMATACLRDLTLWPEEDLSAPRLNSRITVWTLRWVFDLTLGMMAYFIYV
jgi:hypothetical protein